MSQAFMAPGALDADAEAIRRRQAYAQALMQQGGQMPQGGMVGNHYVAPSWTQGLASALKTYMGGKEEDQADKDLRALDTRRRSEMMGDATAFSDALRGAPAKPAFDVPANEMGDQFTMNPTAEKKPDPNEALRVALQSRNPMLNQMGGKIMESQLSSILPKATEWALGERFNEKTGMPEKFMYDKHNPANQQAIGGQQAVKNEFVNGQAVNPYTAAPAAAPAIPLQESKPSDQKLYELAQKEGYKGTFTQWDKERKRAGATNVQNTVSMAAPENEYNKLIGAGIAKEDLATLDAAKQSPETVRNARALREAISRGAITGTAADTRLAIQKALETAGLVGAGKAADTQELMATLGKVTLGGVKTSGLGAGNGFTDNDRKFLESAISGKISDSKENLLRVADLSEKVARASHAKGSKFLTNAQNNPALKNVMQSTVLDDLPGGEVAPSAPKTIKFGALK